MKRSLHLLTPCLCLCLSLSLTLWMGRRAVPAATECTRAERVGTPTSSENVLYEHFHPFTAALLTSEQGQRLANTRPSRIVTSHGSTSYRGAGRTSAVVVNLLNRCCPWWRDVLIRRPLPGSPRMYYVIALRRILR